jgi:hypothetical protein
MPEESASAERGGDNLADSDGVTIARQKLEKRQDRRERWRTAIALVDVIAIGVSVYAVLTARDAIRSQERSAQRQDQATRYQAVTDRLLDVEAFLVEHPNLQPHFYEGKALEASGLSDEDKRRGRALAVVFVDYYDYLYNQLVKLHIAPKSGEFVLRSSEASTQTDDDWLAWSEAVRTAFASGSALCPTLVESRHSYGSAFVHAMRNLDVCPGL